MKTTVINRSRTNHTLIFKTFLILIISLLCSTNGMARSEKNTKKINPSSINQILKNIRCPEYKKAFYNITLFGAVGDGKTDTKPIIDKVINLCSKAGGGQVIIPKGTFFVAGPIVLKSDVNLHFEDGAEIIFSDHEKTICLLYGLCGKEQNFIIIRR